MTQCTPDPSAAELEHRARRGDAEALFRLLRSFDDELRGVVWSVLRDPDAVDEALNSRSYAEPKSRHR